METRLEQPQAILQVVPNGKIKEAEDAGADMAGGDDLVEKIKGGWTEFDACIAAPDMMKLVGPLGKVLGPRGLMPSPRAGTVTPDIGKTVAEYKAIKDGGVAVGVPSLTLGTPVSGSLSSGGLPPRWWNRNRRRRGPR